MRRRSFLAALGGAAVWPTAVPAQQPVTEIGFLNAGLPPTHLVASFRQSLAEAGYTEGRNVTVHYRFAEGKYERLPEMAVGLVQRQVGSASPTRRLVAKPNYTIPIAFNSPD